MSIEVELHQRGMMLLLKQQLRPYPTDREAASRASDLKLRYIDELAERSCLLTVKQT